MESELISIIVPVYNVEMFLKKCVESIINQTYRNLDIILVDDGSTDSSGRLCDAWKALDNRITVIHKPNGGLSDARNAGLSVADGKYCAFIDSDDFISSDTVERLHSAMQEYNCQIAVCNMVRIYEDETTESFYRPVEKLTVLAGQQRFETLKQPSVCNKLFRSELLKGVQFPKGKFYEDTFVYHVLAYRAKKIALTGHDGYYYLSRKESILGQHQYTDRYFDFVEAVYTRMAFLLEHDVPKYGEEACLSLYAAVANSEKWITKTEQNSRNFAQMHEWYHIAYRKLLKSSQIGIKQKIRAILLRYLPSIHSSLF